jgi:hypothetical protein
MTKTFTNQAEAVAALAPLFKAGRISSYTPVTAFGRTTVKIWVGTWKPLTVDLFNLLVK